MIELHFQTKNSSLYILEDISYWTKNYKMYALQIQHKELGLVKEIKDKSLQTLKVKTQNQLFAVQLVKLHNREAVEFLKLILFRNNN